MTTDLDSLATALYVRADDLLKQAPHLAPWRPATGIAPRLTDAELVVLAVMQAMLGYTSEARFLRHARKGERQRPGGEFFRPLRQVIESVNQTLKGQLDIERHGGRTPAGVVARVLQRILALTAPIWHNNHTGQPVMRSLTAYDH